MGSRPVYGADREVIEECQIRGHEVTARQLERWRPLLPDRVVEHAGGVRGSRSMNPAGYVEQVIAIAETLKSGIPLREVPLALFLQEFPVKLDVLRASYLGIFSRVQKEFDAFNATKNPPHSDPGDRVDALAIHMAAQSRNHPTGRRWEARARTAIRQRQVEAGSVQSLLSGVLSAALTGPFTGMPATPEGIAEVLTVFGMNDGQDAGQLASLLATVNLGVMHQAVESATMEQWIAARADFIGMRRYANLLRQIERSGVPPELRLAGLDDFFSHDLVSQAVQIPGLLIIATDEWREILRSELARWEAMESLLTVIPEKYHQPFLLSHLSDEAIRELRPMAEEWVRRHPREAELLNMVMNGTYDGPAESDTLRVRAAIRTDNP